MINVKLGQKVSGIKLISAIKETAQELGYTTRVVRYLAQATLNGSSTLDYINCVDILKPGKTFGNLWRDQIGYTQIQEGETYYVVKFGFGPWIWSQPDTNECKSFLDGLAKNLKENDV